jgi:hypothetical protein
MITRRYAYQRVRARSERTERNLLALIEVILVGVALRGVLELAIVEVLHDRVLHLLLHVQGLKQIKKNNNYENNFFSKKEFPTSR